MYVCIPLYNQFQCLLLMQCFHDATMIYKEVICEVTVCFFSLSHRELADLHKANATKDSEAQEAALSREMKAKEELGLALEKAKDEARQQQEALAIQVCLKHGE